LCSKNIALSLEDDAPVRGERAVFLVDIMNPCWKLPAFDLTQPQRLTASVGQVPFNFQIGDDIHKIPLRQPKTPSGELEVRLGCDGELLGSLPLAAAVNDPAVTALASITLPARGGQHELCFQFTQARLDPLWVLQAIELVPDESRKSTVRAE
jgi:hexosaminidase